MGYLGFGRFCANLQKTLVSSPFLVLFWSYVGAFLAGLKHSKAFARVRLNTKKMSVTIPSITFLLALMIL